MGGEGGRKMGGEDDSILSLTMFRSITSLHFCVSSKSIVNLYALSQVGLSFYSDNIKLSYSPSQIHWKMM